MASLRSQEMLPQLICIDSKTIHDDNIFHHSVKQDLNTCTLMMNV